MGDMQEAAEDIVRRAQTEIEAGRLAGGAKLIVAGLDAGLKINTRFIGWLVRSVARDESCRPALDRIAEVCVDPAVQARLADAGLDRPAYSERGFEQVEIAPAHQYSARVDKWFSPLREKMRHPCAGSMGKNRTPAVDLYTFEDVTLYHSPVGFMIVDRDGRPFRQSSLPLLEKNIHYFKSLPQKAEIEYLFFNGDVWKNYDNYCIWFVNYMSRISWARKMLNPLKIGLPFQGLNSFQAASLDHLNLRPNILNMEYGAYRVRRLSILSSSCVGAVSRLQGGSHAYAAPLLADFAPIAPQGGRRIFLARPPGVRRSVHNHPEIEALLLSKGFEVVDPGKLKFSEQRSLFGEASHVIGLHGAALTNVLFCHPGTKVMEIFPEHYGTRAFAWISDVRDLDYRPIAGKAVNGRPNPWADVVNHDIHLPFEEFRSEVSDFLGES